ncbi:MAG: biotin/lipoyl-containing protein [Alloprevotella sp.]|nr:biotin/lipoyl-containing protein [Alloprevotella sp.]
MKQYKYTINGAQYDVTIDSIVGSKAKVEVNGIPFEVEMHGSSLVEEDLPTMSTEGAPAPAAAPAAPAAAPTAAAPAAKSGPGAGTPVKAPLPGVVTKILVAEGQAVKKGETVLVLEAMKMENNITAEADGNVTGICVAAGDSVMEGTTLLTIG